MNLSSYYLLFISHIFFSFFLYVFSFHLKMFPSPAVICWFLHINAYFWGSHLIYFSSMMIWKWHRFNKILTSHFKFWSFPDHDTQPVRLGRDSELPCSQQSQLTSANSWHTTILCPHSHSAFHPQYSVQQIPWGVQHLIAKQALC